MNQKDLITFIDQQWDKSILPTLEDYILIPNKSPAFDPDWQKNGHMERAVELIARWCKEQNLNNAELSIHRLENRTPLLMIEVKGQSDKTVLLYGHMDKQPEMIGWESDLGPWKPVRKGDRLYGRGGADDGYATFAAVTAIKALQQQNLSHARCVILIEACEESGSKDLPFYIESLQEKIGKPDLVICLDSGCGNYEQFWGTTSLRGLVNGILRITILKEGVHSGAAGGVVPSSSRILRQLLSRIENENTAEILLDELKVKIPDNRLIEAKEVASVLGDKAWSEFPFVENAHPASQDIVELVLNRSWRPCLEITGAAGLPPLENAGNVLRPQIAMKLSIRIPPTCNAAVAAQALKNILEKNPPHHAQVSFDIREADDGWNAPPMQPWLNDAVQQASLTYFGKPALQWGEGGSIPFMGMLGKKFPQAQFVITGVLGPKSNAHGPNEFLHIPMAKKLSCCVAEILSKHYSNLCIANK